MLDEQDHFSRWVQGIFALFFLLVCYAVEVRGNDLLVEV